MKSGMEILTCVEKEIAKKYKSPFSLDGQNCYLYGKDHYFKVTLLYIDDGAIVVEHAHSLVEAKKNFFEDGDLFYIDEMAEDEIVDAIINEVEAT